MIQPLEETGHVGYLVDTADGARVLIDPPLTFDPSGCEGPLEVIVETAIAGHRVSGARLIARGCKVPILAPVTTPATTRVVAGDDILGLLRVEPVLTRPDQMILTMDNETRIFIGSLDRDATAAALREQLTERCPRARFYGSAGVHGGQDLAELDPPPLPVLNREAVILTNSGEADMFWADPRFTKPADSTSRQQLVKRLAGPWPPAIVTPSGPDHQLDAPVRQIHPAALASSFAELAGERELVLWAEDAGLAAQAAGFLRRLGLSGTSWLRD